MRSLENVGAALAVLLLATPAAAQEAARPAVVWHDRGDPAAFNLLTGPAGRDGEPGTDFRFIRESLNGTSPKFGLWSVPDLGFLAYHVAAKLISGEITGAPGETFSVPGLNGDQPYTIGEKSVVILGPPFEFNADNIDQFNF